MLNNTFFTKLNEVGQRAGINPKDLLLVMYLESGVDPSKHNLAGSGAVGLIQFMPDTLKGMGLSKYDIKDFHKLSAEEQLDFVEKYVKGARAAIKGKPFTSAVQYYHANLFPRTLNRWVGDDPKQNENVVVLGLEGKTPETNPQRLKQEIAAYKANGAFFDKEKKGYISVGDLARELNRLSNSSGFKNMLSKFNTVAPTNYKDPNINPPQNQQEQKQQKSNSSDLIAKIKNFLSFIGLASNENKILIVVNSDTDFSNKLEFARILTSALNTELKATSCVFSDNNEVEIECSVYGDKAKVFEATKQLSNAVSDAFYDATAKIGKIKVYPLCVADTSSTYEKVGIKKALINYRKFQLKFAKKGEK